MNQSKYLKKIKLDGLIKMSLVATIYVVVTLMFGEISYGPIQARISEVLTLLAFIDPMYIPGLVLGCAIANFYSFGLIDVVVGSLATFIATYMMYKTKNMFIASLWPVVNCVFVAAELHLLFNHPFWFSLMTIALGEFVVTTVIGYPLFKKLYKNRKFVETIRIDKENKTYLKKLEFE